MSTPPIDPIAVQLDAVLERAARQQLAERLHAACDLLKATVGAHAGFAFLLLHEGWAGAISNAQQEAETIIRRAAEMGGKSELPNAPPLERQRRWAETALPILMKQLLRLCPADNLALAVWFEPPIGLTSVCFASNMRREDVVEAFADCLDVRPSSAKKGDRPS